MTIPSMTDNRGTSETTPLIAGFEEGNGAGKLLNEGEMYISSSGRHGSITFCKHGKNAKSCCQLEEFDERVETMSLKDQSHSASNAWSHCHSPDRDSGGKLDKTARRKLIIACVLCVCFMIAEAVGGILSNSLAIATDAAHLLTDLASFLISLFSIFLASRPASKKYNFGWYRAEVVGAMTSVLLIWVITGILVYMAIQRLITQDYEINALVMLITAGIGVLVNLIMGAQLHGLPGGHGHSHGGGGGGHGHSHSNSNHHVEGGHGHSHTKKQENINVRAAFIHVLGDFFQSLGVLVAAIIIYFVPSWGFIDPICTFLFSILVLFTTYNIIKDVLNVFMEGRPKGIDFLEVQKTLLEIPGVVTVHNLRIWSISLDKIALSGHLAITKGSDPAVVLKAASSVIRSRYDIFELTIQVEEYQEEMGDCNQCKNI